MQLVNAIKDLVYSNDCVTIPGFGSFIANKFPSIYDESESKFYPPSRRLSFNSKIQNNDGLVANYISEKSKISFKKSLELIHGDVVKWKRKINNEPLFLDGIGEFSLNTEKTLVFKPDFNYNHLADSYGLKPIYIHKVENNVLTYNETTLNRYNKLSKSESRNSTPQFLKTAAVFVALIAGTYFAENSYNEFRISQEISFQNEIRAESIKKAEKAIFDFGTLPSINLKINSPASSGKYHIMAGSFRLESNANKLFDLLLSKGYNPTRLPLNDKGLTPISFDNFSNRKDAVIALRKFQKSENKDAWIFEKE